MRKTLASCKPWLAQSGSASGHTLSQHHTLHQTTAAAAVPFRRYSDLPRRPAPAREQQDRRSCAIVCSEKERDGKRASGLYLDSGMMRRGLLSGARALSTAARTPLAPADTPSAIFGGERNLYPLSSSSLYKSKVMLLRGEGIGAEVTRSMEDIFAAAQAPVQLVTPKKDLKLDSGLTEEVDGLFRETRVAVKGPFFTPIAAKNTSVNIQLRLKFDLFANVVHAYNIPGLKTRHSGVDMVIIRENTEGEYSGLEHQVVPGVVESLKIISAEKCQRIAEYAFQYAMANNRRKVTAVHKANIMKSADGLFLDICNKVAKQYPFIEYESMIVDNCCMQLASRPQQFDTLILPNLYGNIVTNIATGLVGGPGMFPGANIGVHGAIFEQGARHAAMQIAGRGVANPTATILGGVMMLRYLKHDAAADAIEQAVYRVYSESNIRTADTHKGMPGKPASTGDFTKAVIAQL
jgi:isocitrate dehydrogenase (NAD+)